MGARLPKFVLQLLGHDPRRPSVGAALADVHRGEWFGSAVRTMAMGDNALVVGIAVVAGAEVVRRLRRRHLTIS